MTLVLLTPIALDAGCWEGVPLPEGPVYKHVFPGLGGRPRAPQPPTMASLADGVAAGCEGPLDVVGQSLGGMVALHLALRHPARVRSLLVACTGAATKPDVMEARAAAAEAGGMEGVLAVTLERWFTAQALAMEPEHPAVTYARRTLLALDPAVFAEYWRAIGGHDVVARLHEIAAPTTALAGTADAASPLERSRALGEGVQHGRLVVMDGPHMMALEHPAEFGAALADHLRWAGGAERVTRLPLLGIEPQDEIVAEVFAGFAKEGRDPIALYRVLAHSPRMLRAYAGLARGLRYEAETPRALRELMILRVAQLTASDYEWAHHRAMAAANGVAEEQVAALAEWRSSERFDARERAALRCAEEIHEIALSEEAFAALERELGASASVELVLLASFYETVARIIQALDLEVEPEYRQYLGEAL